MMTTTLEMFKMLSNEDRKNLDIYCVYDSIYEVMDDNNVKLDDDEIERIKESSRELFLEDRYYNLSQRKIAEFITDCYITDDNFFDKTNHMRFSEILEAISEDDKDFYKDEEMER